MLGLLLGLLFVTPFVVVYFLIIRWIDRFEPEPWWLLILAFIWGALFSTLGGGLSSGYVQSIVADWQGLPDSSEEMHAFAATVLAPIFEEGFKGMGVAMIAGLSYIGLREIDGPLDGAIYGGVVGLGFTLTEDILYVARQYAEGGFKSFIVLLFVRTVLLGLSHCTFTACTGLGFGIAADSRKLRTKILAPLIGFICAMGLHHFHNVMPTKYAEVGTAFMIVVSLFIDLAFFVLLGLLVTRDRQVVLRELAGELGGLIHPHELSAISTYFAIGRRNMAILFADGFRPFFQRRRKQLALVELAFIKNRRRRGEFGLELDVREARLRQEIYFANQRGVWIGT